MRLFTAILLAFITIFPASAGSLDALSQRDMIGGLKQSLTQSATVAVSKLGQENGFLNSDKVRIPLPESLAKIEGLLRNLGMGHYADELITAMNHAAETAVTQAKPLLIDAVKKMTVNDAKNILTGGEDAATAYFRNATQEPLRAKFTPIVVKAIKKVGVGEKYNQYAGKAAAFGLMKERDANLELYVTQKTLDGLYIMMAEEEKAIRQDPSGQASSVVRKVFGALLSGGK